MILAAMAMAAVVGCSRPPSDAWILEKFERERSKFARLVQMSEQDYHVTRVTRIAHDFTRLESDWAWPRPVDAWGVSAPRWDEYRELFRSLDLPFGINRDGPRSELVLVPLWGKGWLSHTHERGVLWSAAEVESSRGKYQKFTVRSLGGGWYLYDWLTS